jgi:uncharacterized protein YjiS (DUF1127 family)
MAKTLVYQHLILGNRTMILLPLLNAFQAWRNKDRVSHELNRMTDRELADIGIVRSDIESVVQGTFVRKARI